MLRNKCLFLVPAMFCLLVSLTQARELFAKDQKFNPEDVVMNHLLSIGDPGVLKKMQSRTFKGTASFEFVQGVSGSSSDGQMIFASEGNKLGLVLKYKDLVYPGEYFAFNGQDVTVGYISPGQRSPLADFIFRYNRLMKEGLLGGVWSVSWPLLDIQKNKPDLKYKLASVGGRQLHELEYRPQKNLGDLSVKLFFDFDTFRHVRTEYRVRISDDNSTRLEAGALRRGTGISRFPGGPDTSEIFDAAPDSFYLFVEKFDDFRNYGGLTLPSVCSYEYSIDGQGRSFVAHWSMKASAVMIHNQKVREDFFTAQK